jgi:hypothetical protein
MRYRPNPLHCAKIMAREYMNEIENSPHAHVIEISRERLFTIHLLAIRVGWKSLEKEINEFETQAIKGPGRPAT